MRSTARTIRVLGVQIAVPPVNSSEDRDALLLETAEKIGHALEEEPADLVVLPELSGINYSRNAFERLGEYAENLDGRSVGVYGSLAARHGTFIAFGMPRVDQGEYFISHVVVGPDGRCAGYYDKLHTAQFGASMEKDYFCRGDHLFVFDVKGVKIAPVICYDFRFPDLVATLCRVHRVNLVIHPVAFYRDRSFPSWHHIAIARAVENQIYFLSLNRAGEQYGSSIWCPPWMDESLKPERFGSNEALRYFTVDMEIIDRVRGEFPFAEDRLPDYRDLPEDRRRR